MAALAAVSAIYASLQCAGAVAGCAQLCGVRRQSRLAWAAASLFVLALGLCLADPSVTAPLSQAGHMALYLGLALLFGRSLRPGSTPVATRLALYLHTTLSLRRATYTRAVTSMWLLYFVAQLAACTALAIWPAAAALRWAVALHLPLAAALAAAELAARSLAFRGQPHGLAADMLRAARRRT